MIGACFIGLLPPRSQPPAGVAKALAVSIYGRTCRHVPCTYGVHFRFYGPRFTRVVKWTSYIHAGDEKAARMARCCTTYRRDGKEKRTQGERTATREVACTYLRCTSRSWKKRRTSCQTDIPTCLKSGRGGARRVGCDFDIVPNFVLLSWGLGRGRERGRGGGGDRGRGWLVMAIASCGDQELRQLRSCGTQTNRWVFPLLFSEKCPSGDVFKRQTVKWALSEGEAEYSVPRTNAAKTGVCFVSRGDGGWMFIAPC